MDLTATQKSINITLTNEEFCTHNDLGQGHNYCLKSEYNTPALCENEGHILRKALNKELHRAKPPPLLME